MKKRLVQLLPLFAILGTWILLYRNYPDAPAPLGPHEGLGWWGWFDQGQYLKISEQWSNLDFFNPDKYYPPLYPGIIGLIWPIFGKSGYIVLDAGCALLFSLLLIQIFRSYLSIIIIFLSVALAYGFNSHIFAQWVIPWTTNLSSVLIIYLAWLLHRQYQHLESTSAEHKNTTKNVYSNQRQDLTIALGICAAMLALRPFEIIPCLILTLGIWNNAVKSSLLESKSCLGDSQHSPKQWQQWKHLILNLAPTIIPAFLLVITYATYNILTFGSLEPSYSKEINSMGFNFLDIGFKYASLVNDSSVFGIKDGHLTNLVPWYPLMIAAALIGAFTLATPIRYLIAASLISQISYLGFNDLVPTGLFTFNNIHYFTWSIAVIGVASFATIANIFNVNILSKKSSRKSIVATIFSLIAIAVVMGSCKPTILETTVKSPQWTILCEQAQERQDTFYTRVSAFHQEVKSSKPAFSRLLILEIETESKNENIHTANASELALSINKKKLTYRKDWRFVSKSRDGKTLLAILLQHEIPLSNLKIDLKIGSGSNIHILNPCKLYTNGQ